MWLSGHLSVSAQRTCSPSQAAGLQFLSPLTLVMLESRGGGSSAFERDEKCGLHRKSCSCKYFHKHALENSQDASHRQENANVLAHSVFEDDIFHAVGKECKIELNMMLYEQLESGILKHLCTFIICLKLTVKTGVTFSKQWGHSGSTHSMSECNVWKQEQQPLQVCEADWLATCDHHWSSFPRDAFFQNEYEWPDKSINDQVALYKKIKKGSSSPWSKISSWASIQLASVWTCHFQLQRQKEAGLPCYSWRTVVNALKCCILSSSPVNKVLKKTCIFSKWIAVIQLTLCT